MAGNTVLCIRTPDSDNEYSSDGDIEVITIDIGSEWASYNSFAEAMANGDEAALEYEQHYLKVTAHLSEDNAVRKEVKEFFATARQEGSR